MKFSIFLEMQISQPTRETERQLFHDCVEQVVLADQLGYHCAWTVEHHGLYEYAHSSAPEVFLAYVAARTKRIRLGHGVTLTPGRYNHPNRIAERVAALDILSEGRVNWGSGKSASRVEQGAFEVDRDELHAQWLEALEMIPRIWRSDIFEWNSRFYNIPPTQVVPKPVQRPHPPIYAACSSAENAAALGALGVGALNFAQGTDDFLVKKVQAYREAIADATPRFYQPNNHFACTPTALVLEDDHEACVHGFRGSRFFGQGLARYYFTDQRPLGPLDVPRDDLTPDLLKEAKASRSRSGGPLLAIVGDPASARESVARFQSAGVDELILIMQMGTVPHELIMRSMRVFAEQVMPHFA
jgi:alkanesulfonate monooxygenase SsuD/methylene tetrahydromethanopterin reductase-like flavin-dependent oxidoreductase (luciferase family)